MKTGAALHFPPRRAAWLSAAGAALPPGLRWRDAGDADLPFLRRLYGDTRAAELAAAAWPDLQQQAFLDSQFALQHRHYTAHYQPADYLLIEDFGAPVGRLYLHHDDRDAHLIDIALLASACGRGIGTALLRCVQGCVRRDRLHGIVLHVEQRNLAARRLYQRLGFAAVADTGSHLRMHWRANAIS